MITARTLSGRPLVWGIARRLAKGDELTEADVPLIVEALPARLTKMLAAGHTKQAGDMARDLLRQHPDWGEVYLSVGKEARAGLTEWTVTDTYVSLDENLPRPGKNGSGRIGVGARENQTMKRSFKIWRVVVVTLAVVVIAGGIAYYKGALQPFGLYRPSNALMVIAPYKYAGTWVFDDPAVGLNREPFVSGIPEMISDMVKDIPNAEKGFRLLFSTQPFPGHTHKLTWRRGDKSGNWYYCEQYDKEGWLCPSLFRYYQEAPKEIYAKAESK